MTNPADMATSELLAAYIENVALLARVRGEQFGDMSEIHAAWRIREALALEIDRRLPNGLP